MRLVSCDAQIMEGRMLLAETAAERLHRLIGLDRARIGVVGLGYVGLPLAAAFAERFLTIGFDTNSRVASGVNAGFSHIDDVGADRVKRLIDRESLFATADFARLGECDCVIICVPTPLDENKQPDLSYIVRAAETVADFLRKGSLVVLESTSYPGTTDELLLGALREAGLVLDESVFVAFSPERVDPGRGCDITTVPKVVGGCSEESGALAAALYERVFDSVHRVSNARIAEMSKLFENTFQAVNIAFVNEMAISAKEMGIDFQEVLDAASTKPYGFMRFDPGPGVGGHCIPIDPLYLSWKARQHRLPMRFVQLADDVNDAMPAYVVDLVTEALNEIGLAVSTAHVLVLGVAYKKNVDDAREAPAEPIIKELLERGAEVHYHDPHVAKFAVGESSLMSVPLTDGALRSADCVLVLTAHDAIDFSHVARVAKSIVDTRHVVPKNLGARVTYL